MQSSGRFCGTVYRSSAQWAFIASQEAIKCEALSAKELLEADKEWAELDADQRAHFEDKSHRLAPESLAMLQAGIESAKNEPLVDLGSFAKYAEDETE